MDLVVAKNVNAASTAATAANCNASLKQNSLATSPSSVNRLLNPELVDVKPSHLNHAEANNNNNALRSNVCGLNPHQNPQQQQQQQQHCHNGHILQHHQFAANPFDIGAFSLHNFQNGMHNSFSTHQNQRFYPTVSASALYGTADSSPASAAPATMNNSSAKVVNTSASNNHIHSSLLKQATTSASNTGNGTNASSANENASQNGVNLSIHGAASTLAAVVSASSSASLSIKEEPLSSFHSTMNTCFSSTPFRLPACAPSANALVQPGKDLIL
jgi:hypothetical protein